MVYCKRYMYIEYIDRTRIGEKTRPNSNRKIIRYARKLKITIIIIVIIIMKREIMLCSIMPTL